jgi:very-short-patch-repair endonuclease
MRHHKGIRAHVSRVPAEQRTAIDRIPVTSLERTLLDYAEQATPRQLLATLEAAERRNVLDLQRLQHVKNHSPGRRGLKPLSDAIARLSDDPAWTQSPLEDLFLELIRDSDLALPRANVLVEGELVDFVWPEQRVIVEIDGFAFHATHEAFENDRRRDIRLQKLGWRVLRITYRRLHGEPEAVLADIRAMLNQ